jgi:hypothetical protein
MSNVKAKNAVIRAIRAEVGKSIPAGVEFRAELSEGRLYLRLDSLPFDAHAPGVIKLTPHGYQMTMSLMGDDGYTDEARAVVARMKELATAAVREHGAYLRVVVLSGDATKEQVARMRALEQFNAAVAAAE